MPRSSATARASARQAVGADRWSPTTSTPSRCTSFTASALSRPPESRATARGAGMAGTSEWRGNPDARRGVAAPRGACQPPGARRGRRRGVGHAAAHGPQLEESITRVRQSRHGPRLASAPSGLSAGPLRDLLAAREADPGGEAMTDYLYARPSFLAGAARTLDFMGLFDSYNMSPTEAEADATAMFADWRAVGEDLFLVMRQHPDRAS